MRLGPSNDGEAPLRVGLSGPEAESSQEPVVRFAALWVNFNEGAAICAAARAREEALVEAYAEEDDQCVQIDPRKWTVSYSSVGRAYGC